MLLSIWILGLGVLIYHRIPLLPSLFAIYGGLLISWALVGISAFFAISLGLVLSIACLPFVHPTLRKRYLTTPIFKYLKRTLPKISDTEKVALSAGSVWWESQIFSGAPDWQKLKHAPLTQLTPEEKQFLEGPVETLCSMISEWEIMENNDLPSNIWQFLKENKFFALIIQKQYGGLEFSALAHSEILAKIAGKSITLASTVAVPNSLGPAELLQHYGTEAQKDYYLPRLATGEDIPCFALTSAEAGSDATSIIDYGVICYQDFQGEKTLGIRLTWQKRYITLAPIATILGLAFKLYDPEHLIGDQTNVGITCALIPTRTEGVITGDRHRPLTACFQNGPTEGRDVFIPIDWIIGGQAMAGHGWRMLVECLSCGRAISLPSSAVGSMKIFASTSGAYARIRQQFKQPIGYFEGIEEPLAKIAANTYISDAARLVTASTIDNGEKPAILGAIIKYHLTEMSRNSSIYAMDIHGGKGIMQGPHNYLAQGYINAPIGITVEGANILTRSLIIFGQGAIRCHPYLLKELQALETDNEANAIDQLDDAFCKHMGYVLSNTIRSIIFYWTKAFFVFSPEAAGAKPYYRKLTWASSTFALLSDACLLFFGGKLKFKEKLSGRLGDLLAYQYLGACLLKKFQKDNTPSADLPILQFSMETLLHQYWSTFQDIIHNLPHKSLRFIMKIITMPFGIPCNKPSDKLGKQVAKCLLEPNATRDRLLEGAFLSWQNNNLTGQLEYALKQVLAAEPLEALLHTAIKDGLIQGRQFEDIIQEAINLSIISSADAVILRQAKAARDAVTAVDSFSQDGVARQQKPRSNQTEIKILHQ